MSPLLYRLSYRAAIAAKSLKALSPGAVRYAPAAMLMIAGFLGQTPNSLGQTIALLLTFLGIGVIVNVLIIYVVAQVLAERKQNNERARRPG
ncbi:MAG: hypothetical protein ACLQA5_24260 [Solirubrobacteraceae bacterium]